MMKATLEAFRRDWRSILVQAVVSAVVLIALIWLLAWGLGSIERDERISKQVDATHELLCELATREGVNGRQEAIRICNRA